MADYDSWVDTYEIHPPVGDQYGWGAKARVKEIGTGRPDDIVTLHEHWGNTEEEARTKAQEEANEWIASRSSE